MALPVLHRRRSKSQRALHRARTHAKAWLIVKATKVSHRAARRSAKAYGKAKGKKARRPIVAVIAVPVVAGGAVIAWRKTRSNHRDEGPARPLGPVATADSVSPPAARSDNEPAPPVPQQTPTS